MIVFRASAARDQKDDFRSALIRAFIGPNRRRPRDLQPEDVSAALEYAMRVVDEEKVIQRG